MAMTPIELTLYDPETNEALKTYSRSFIPWEILKRAIRLQKSLNIQDMSEDNVDELASLVVAVFGDQFTLEQVNKGADIGEMAAVMQAVVTRASQFVQGRSNGNPTKAAEM